MTRPWRLTKQAQDSLVDIALWTFDTFGPRQAQAYEDDLIERCEGIASGLVTGQDCAILVDKNAGQGPRFARAGRHFIVYLDRPEQITVIDFLHAQCDIPARISALQTAF